MMVFELIDLREWCGSSHWPDWWGRFLVPKASCDRHNRVMGEVLKGLVIHFLGPDTLSKLVGASFWSGVLPLTVSRRRRIPLLAFARRVGPDLFSYAS
jgi:hypothetical protein